MKPAHAPSKTNAVRILAVSAALIWVAGDLAQAGQGRAGSTRGSSSSSSASSSSSGSQSSGSGRTAVSRSSSSRSSAPDRGSVRSGSSTRRSSGAARTRSRERTYHRRGRGHRGYFGVPYYWNPWGYWGWGVTFGHGYGYGHYGHQPVVYSSHRGYRMGALDLNVRPKNTEIYVDGQYVGLAKKYDGFPGHLWLENGVYEIAFYRPGFETQTRTVKILTDLILDLDIEMRVGEAVRPEMNFGPEAEDDPSDEGWVESRRFSRGDYQSRLHLDVEPGAALIYLDGNILGTADELAGLHAGLILSAGRHTLQVVHRGYESVERSIVVEPGEEVQFDLRLEPAAGNASP